MVEPILPMAGGGRAALPLELRWSAERPLPLPWVIPEGRQAPTRTVGQFPLDFGAAMARLCADIALHCPALRHVRTERVLVAFTPARNRNRFGLQARITPLRFADGGLLRRYRRREYQVQRFFVDGVEMLYVLAFCLPRFLDQSFDEKLSTIFHELFHMSPAFDGGLRRLDDRCALHSRSKARYEAHVKSLARAYLADQKRPELLAFLRFNYRELWVRHGGIRAALVPRPKLLPVGSPSRQAAKKG
ncbi:MAG TPA: hypothetical protein VN641_21110 [Urbifossiella sp.]|jgi:hypothetical protein|nr:hypothetical protein [Urbifossiella sp.]